ncbi:hypothetical protein Tco_1219841 [Tanacetum coccineum]
MNRICIWPFEWVEKYLNLSLIQNVVIDEFKQDEMMDIHKRTLINTYSFNATILLNSGTWKISLRRTKMEWSRIMNNMAMEYNGNSNNNIIRRLGLAASVYLLRYERNNRLFKREKRIIDKLYEVFVETIRLRLSSLKAKLTKVPRVLVTCRSRLGRQMELLGDETNIVPLYYHIVDNIQIQFGREEFSLVTGLRFGVEYTADYNNEDEPIPFRRRVFPSAIDGKPIIGKTLENLIDSELFYRLHDDDAVSLCCVGILQFVLLGLEDIRRVPDWILRLANDRDGWDNREEMLIRKRIRSLDLLGQFKTWILESFRVGANDYYKRHRRYPRIVAWSSKKKFYRHMVHDFFHGRLPTERLTPDENEARSDWWVSSKAYFDGSISEAERIPHHFNRQNLYEVPSEFYRDFEQQKRALEQMMKKDAEREKTYEQMRKFMEDMKVGPVRQANKGPIIVDQHYGLSDFSGFQSLQRFRQGGPSSFSTQENSSFFEGAQATPYYGHNMATPNWQTPLPSQLGTSNWQSQMPSQSATPNWEPRIPSCPGTSYWQSQMPSHWATPNWQPPILLHPHDAGLFNLNILNRARREPRPSIYRQSPYMDLPPIMVLPKKRVDKTKNKGKKAKLSPLNLGNAFADDNVGDDDVMITGVHETGIYFTYENVDPNKVTREDYNDCMEFILNPYDVYLDCHMMGYLVPASFWRQLVLHLCMTSSHSLDWPYQDGWLSGDVYMPINAGGNHRVTGAINLPNSIFYVFDSMESERTSQTRSDIVVVCFSLASQTQIDLEALTRSEVVSMSYCLLSLQKPCFQAI